MNIKDIEIDMEIRQAITGKVFTVIAINEGDRKLSGAFGEPTVSILYGVDRYRVTNDELNGFEPVRD